MALDRYRQRRDFDRTPEPSGRRPKTADGPRSFVVQQHDARRMHYDFRLEHRGVLKSWAVPKGPSLDPSDKRLAVETEDHPLEYADFEGVIPEHEYGAGAVLVWDRGYWFPEGDVERGLADGRLNFSLAGEKLRGRWSLVRMKRRPREKKDSWLLIKRRDEEARAPDGEIVEQLPTSVISGRRIGQVEADRDRQWSAIEPGDPSVSSLGRPESIEGARAAAMPAKVTPQLATLVEEPPRGEGWLGEMKLDGYRLLAYLEPERVRLVTRNGKDWTARLPRVADALARDLSGHRALIDGELVALDRAGRPRFQLLQRALGSEAERLYFYAFDLLYLDGYDLRPAALGTRKEALRLLLAAAGPAVVRYCDHVVGPIAAFFDEACRAGLEGIVCKRAGASYRSGRSRSWLKIKCIKRQEVVVVGFTEPSKARAALGALLVAVNEAGDLRYAGKVGTGFGEATLAMLRRRLEAIEVEHPPLAPDQPGLPRRGVHWVRPEMVVEVAFSEWTDQGQLRHPSFAGMREDKPAREAVRERPEPPAFGRGGGCRIAGVTLSHPDKVLYPEQNLTKRDLASYYEAVAEAVLPEVEGRPLTLLRCPDGRHEGCFHQKRAGDSVPRTVPRVEVRPGEEYLQIDGLPALITLVQLGALELHVWGARVDRLERPDRLVIDLDPGPGVRWAETVATAEALRDRLAGLGLSTFVRVTGGKGLHLILPITRHSSWADARAFTQGLARELVRHAPEHFVDKMTRRIRHGKIFIDYLRNAREATAIASYSVRARPGAPVAAPIAWDELEPRRAGPPVFYTKDVIDRVAGGVDPWASLPGSAKRLTRAMLDAVGAER